MDEPMEDSSGDAPVNASLDTESAPKPSVNRSAPMAMGSSMVSMTITMEDYEKQYWPKLEGAINQLLTMKSNDYIPISYEQMYSCVYKCVCKQFSERLYKDLLKHITAYLERMCLELQVQDPHAYIERFNFAMTQYLQALGGIVPIFNYMNRFYVESKLKTDLSMELKKLFVQFVAEKHVPNLIPLLVDANTKPFSVPPATMACIISSLHSLKPEFAQLRPQLFAKYIPNVLPPCSAEDLDLYRDEVKQMQRDLMTHPLYTSGDQTRKRLAEEDVPKASPMAFMTRGTDS